MKWFGAFLLVSASFFCGQTLSKQEGRRLAAVDSLLGFFQYLRRRIISERTPLYRLFSEYKDSFLEETGFLKILSENPRDISNRFSQSILLLPLDNEIINELSRFGNELGKIRLDEQIKRIDGIIDLLQSEKTKISQSIIPKQKSIKTVCLLFGLLTAILLL